MMEHVRMFDWCASVHDRYFVEETDLDNCNTEKILRNKFVDPLLSSDSEDDERPNKINWDEIFNNKQIQRSKLFVPCLRQVPAYPKLSSMDFRKHLQFLKVLSADNPHILPDLFIGKPTRNDIKFFETAKEEYLKEQKEYKEWAKSLWTTDHCIRALRPKPTIETVYEAEYKIRAQRVRSLPKNYDIAAQIPLESTKSNCDMVLKQELITVPLSDMAQVQVPDKITKQFSIIRPCTVPEPCQLHPYQIVLPTEDAVSILPITEIHRELATYALHNDAQYIASENALKCLLQWNRHWLLPLSVCRTIGPDGEAVNVVVLGSEFSVHKESAPVRTYKAFRHLLEHALIPPSERERILENSKSKPKKKVISSPKFDVNAPAIATDVEMTSDDDGHLYIDTGEEIDMDAPKLSPRTRRSKRLKTDDSNTSPRVPRDTRRTRAAARLASDDCADIGVYTCTCKDTLFEHPPRRSYKRWQFRNKATNENHDIIIHCAHKTRDKSGEIIIEPLPEYQIDLGASEQSADSLRSIALSLALRKHASVLNARIDGQTGDVATFESMSSEDWRVQHAELRRQALGTVHAALCQLQGLLPGDYVLQHEQSHGANCLLVSARATGAAPRLRLQFDSTQLVDADEAHTVKAAPVLCDVLLPYHKHRRILPCAFTPHETQIAKDSKKPPPKKKAPPQAIKVFPQEHEKFTN
uniref:Little elongation complex subunit 2 C-terminal domain-containing protein n=1 Tax=Heliothis virescens TaxID=7102 RepID=A0A2A4IXC6_HELVI